MGQKNVASKLSINYQVDSESNAEKKITIFGAPLALCALRVSRMRAFLFFCFFPALFATRLETTRCVTSLGGKNCNHGTNCSSLWYNYDNYVHEDF